MPPSDASLTYLTTPPQLQQGTMLVAFSGWMDGGDVSVGTVQRLVDQLGASTFAAIDPEGFYIYNFPGSMEITALFRPNIRIENGELREVELPSNRFSYSGEHKLVFFVGKEPNLHWQAFSEHLFNVAKHTGVSRMVFVGSFGGAVPHTREPRLYATVSHRALRSMLKPYGVKPSNYEGPGSFTTFLINQAQPRGLEMISLIAEIPAYIQGTNPLSIEAVTRRLAAIVGIRADLAELREQSDEWESQVSDAVAKDPELAEKIRELESQYDDELVKSSSTDAWPDEESPSE